MKEVELTEGKTAVISDEDLELVSKYKWSAVQRNDSWYALSFVDSRVCSMHKLVMTNMTGKPQEKGEVIDHINQNPLDNRRENLRLCHRTENGMNRGKNKNNTSGFKGVMTRTATRNGKKFYIKHTHRESGNIHREYFYTAEAAALRYDDIVNELYELPFLNFPEISDSDRSSIADKEVVADIEWHKSRGIQEWSSYVGVHRHSDGKHWRARVRHDGKTLFDKLFIDEVEAAKARDKAAVELGIEKLRPIRFNFPKEIKGE